MLQIRDFSFTGDFHLINWPATIKYNVARYASSWIVLIVLILIFYRGPNALGMAAVLPISLPLAAFVFHAASLVGRVGGLFALVGLYFALCCRVIRLALMVPGDLILSAMYAIKRDWFLKVFGIIPPLVTSGFVVWLVDGSQAPGVHTYR
jgi:hypothetical protein